MFEYTYIHIFFRKIFPEITPIIISSAFAHCSHDTTKVHPNLPEEEVKVDMMVLARKRPMRWKRGKIVEILTKGKKNIFFIRKLITTD